MVARAALSGRTRPWWLRTRRTPFIYYTRQREVNERNEHALIAKQNAPNLHMRCRMSYTIKEYLKRRVKPRIWEESVQVLASNALEQGP